MTFVGGFHEQEQWIAAPEVGRGQLMTILAPLTRPCRP